MTLNINKFLTHFIPTFIVLFVIHFLLVRAVPNGLGMSQKILIESYVFLFLLTLVHFLALRWLFKKWPKYSGLLFTALSLIKMGLCILYLFPYIFPPNEKSIPIALNFMVDYFILLTFEVVFLVKNMNMIIEMKRANKNQ
ncbi:MAG: hypothetical protein JEZ09_05255 [Salinivirgaceae bacterium]|nr:hypothetical protein [Salinivirgaceae bacterium]